MKKNIQKIFLLGLLVSSTAVFSQIKEERLILDKKREPEVKKIEKKKTSVETIKNYPPEEKSQTPVNYDITNVPAVSDFKTSTIAGEDISPDFSDAYQNNYVQFGMGNYGKILADGNVSYTLENKMEVGVDAHVISTEGLKKDYAWSSKQSKANVGAFLNSYGEMGKFNLNADYEGNNYNYYGIYALEPNADINLQQKTDVFRVNGYYDFYSNNILNDFRVKTSFLGDHFDAKESAASIALNLSKHAVELPLNEVTLNADVGLNLETVRSEFQLLDQNSSNYFLTDIAPKVTFNKGKSYIMIGSGFSFLNSKFNNLNLTEEYSASETYWFPRAEIQIAQNDRFKFFGGVDGGLTLNTYESLLRENPYLVSDQMLLPTRTRYKLYFGIRGDLNEQVKYSLQAGFAKMNNIMFFKGDDLFDYNNTLNRSAYNFANTFSAVYDDGSMNEILGSIQYFPLANLSLDGELKYNYYRLDNYDEILNRPLIQVQLGGKYTMLDNKLLLGAKGFFVTDRNTNMFIIQESTTDPMMYESAELPSDKITGYADINLSAEYKVHKNFSIFALGNNLMNKKYQAFKGYKVLGAQILGGVKITF